MLAARIFAQGSANLLEAQGGKGDGVDEVFRRYVEAMFPHLKTDQAAKDEEMKAAMQKEVAKGVITFRPAMETPLRARAKQMALPDEFRKKLQDRIAAHKRNA